MRLGWWARGLARAWSRWRAAREQAWLRRQLDTMATPRVLCGKYLGDNDATCPQLTCIRDRHHDGLCDNVRGDE